MEFIVIYTIWFASWAGGPLYDDSYCGKAKRLHEIDLELAITVTQVDEDIDLCF